MFTLWEKLDEKERALLRGFMPPGWEPSRSIELEPLEVIAELMQELPAGDAALIGRKGY